MRNPNRGSLLNSSIVNAQVLNADANKAPFGSCKIISRKWNIFWKCYFLERKMYLGCLAASEFVLRKINSGVWFVQTFYGKWVPFYGKSIPMFGSVKHFTENGIRFLWKINSHVWFVDYFTENMKCLTISSTCIT